MLYVRAAQHGHKITNFILDNDFLQELKQAFKNIISDINLFPPHIYRANAAEKALRTFKTHFFIWTFLL